MKFQIFLYTSTPFKKTEKFRAIELVVNQLDHLRHQSVADSYLADKSAVASNFYKLCRKEVLAMTTVAKADHARQWMLACNITF